MHIGVFFYREMTCHVYQNLTKEKALRISGIHNSKQKAIPLTFQVRKPQILQYFTRAHRGLPVGFLLLRYSVLFTIESLSLLYLLVIS